MSELRFESQSLDALEGWQPSDFDCGVPELDGWFVKAAVPQHRAGLLRVTVWTDHNQDRYPVVAYYAICPTSITVAELNDKMRGGQSATVSGFMLAKLALSKDLQKQHLGTHLLMDALETICSAAALAGGRVIVVDPINDDASRFYLRHGFIAIRESTRLYMLVKNARASIDKFAAEDQTY
jgi:ribosomal protein S18 acetylase RimI-like enzyme